MTTKLFEMAERYPHPDLDLSHYDMAFSPSVILYFFVTRMSLGCSSLFKISALRFTSYYFILLYIYKKQT